MDRTKYSPLKLPTEKHSLQSFNTKPPKSDLYLPLQRSISKHLQLATMDASDQWTTHHQGIIGVVKDSELTRTLQLQCDNNNNNNSNSKRVIRPNYKEQPLNCPRCNSSNTKFCYYNNYSLSQPRYFCKTCRRYWTDGGSLRNVPVGGGSRKNKRPSSSSSSSSAAQPQTFPPPNPDLILPMPPIIPLIPSSKFYDHDLNLCFPKPAAQSSGHYGFVPGPESCPGFGTGFGFQEFMRESNMKLPLGDDHHGGAGRLLFPFEDLRQVQMSNGGGEDQQSGGMVEQGAAHDPSLFW